MPTCPTDVARRRPADPGLVVSSENGGQLQDLCSFFLFSLFSFFFIYITYRVFCYNKSLSRDTDCVAYRPRSKTCRRAMRDFQRSGACPQIRGISIRRDPAPKVNLKETRELAHPLVILRTSLYYSFSFRHARRRGFSSRLHESHVCRIPQGLNGTNVVHICSRISHLREPFPLTHPSSARRGRRRRGARRFSGNISRDVSSE